MKKENSFENDDVIFTQAEPVSDIDIDENEFGSTSKHYEYTSEDGSTHVKYHVETKNIGSLSELLKEMNISKRQAILGGMVVVGAAAVVGGLVLIGAGAYGLYKLNEIRKDRKALKLKEHETPILSNENQNQESLSYTREEDLSFQKGADTPAVNARSSDKPKGFFDRFRRGDRS